MLAEHRVLEGKFGGYGRYLKNRRCQKGGVLPMPRFVGVPTTHFRDRVRFFLKCSPGTRKKSHLTFTKNIEIEIFNT